MNKSMFLVISVLLSLASSNLFAECAARAVYRAPEIPELKETNFEQVVQLEKAVKNYIVDADQRLEECGRKTSPLSYNLAVGRMERVAKAYNELVEFYNRSSETSSLAVASN